MEEEYQRVLAKGLSLLSRRAYSSQTLYKKLLQKHTSTHSKNVVNFFLEEGIINDEKLCNDIACTLVCKKPYSKHTIINKLTYYGFERSYIYNAMHYVEVLYQKGELEIFSFAGGTLCALSKVHDTKHFLSLEDNIWNVLALCAYIEISHKDSSLQQEKIINRLRLRGFNLSSIYRTIRLYKACV